MERHHRKHGKIFALTETLATYAYLSNLVYALTAKLCSMLMI